MLLNVLVEGRSPIGRVAVSKPLVGVRVPPPLPFTSKVIMRDKERYVYIATLVFVLIGGLVIGRAWSGYGPPQNWFHIAFSISRSCHLPVYLALRSRVLVDRLVKNQTTKTSRCRGRGRVIPRDLALSVKKRPIQQSLLSAVLIKAAFIGLFDQVWGALAKSLFEAVKTVV